MPAPLAVSTPNDFEVVVTRTFDAPRKLVFDCHTKPELVRRWLLGPPGWSLPVCEIDLRVGGRFRYVWRSDAGGSEFSMTGTYREIVAPERTIHTEAFEGTDMGEALVTTVFAETGDRTMMTMTISYPSREVRDAAIATGMTEGMEMSYARLERMFGEFAA